MAYRHARAGTCEAGTCISGLVPYSLLITIGGTERGILWQGARIDQVVDGAPQTMSFQCYGYTPEVGQEVLVYDDGATRLIFGGTIIRRSARSQVGDPVIWDVQCVDWRYLMDKNALVYEDFDNVAMNVAVVRILQTYVDPVVDIKPGNLPEAFGKISMVFGGVPVSAAIDKIAKAVGAYWTIDPNKYVHVFTQYPDGNALTLDDTTSAQQLMYEEDLAPVRNRVVAEGGGSQTTEVAQAGSSTIVVDDTTGYRINRHNDVVLGFGPVAYWRFEETSGTVAADSTPNGNDAEYQGGFTLGTDGASTGSSAVSLDSTSGTHVELSGLTAIRPGLGDMSWVIWFRTTTTAESGLYRQGANGESIQIVVNEFGNLNRVRCLIEHPTLTNVSVDTIAVVVTDGLWHVVLVAFDRDGDVTLYIDGVERASADASSLSAYNYISGIAADGLGSTNGVTNQNFNGDLDECWVIDRVLSADEALSIYESSDIHTYVRARNMLIEYTGVSAESGPGMLTGCTGITNDIPQGERVSFASLRNDEDAQDAMETVLSQGQSPAISGVIVHRSSQSSISSSQDAIDAATGDLEFSADPFETLRYRIVDPHYVAGKTVAVSTTTPVAISGTFRVQSVSLSFRGDPSPRGVEHEYEITRDVTARPVQRKTILSVVP